MLSQTDSAGRTTTYRYNELGQITQISTGEQKQTFEYNDKGYLIAQTDVLANGEIQTYLYNVKNQLIKAIIQKPNQMKEEWQYQYDVLGRRTSKVRLENGKILADSQVEFIWDGSHLVQEIEHKTDRTFSYIYSHPNSYEPLAQLEFAKDNEKPTACYYYHNDQIGISKSGCMNDLLFRHIPIKNLH